MTVVFVHGVPNTAAVWEPVRSLMPDRDTIALQLPGFGSDPGLRRATLTATWTFAPALLSEEAVRDLAERWFGALAALVRHTEQAGAGGRSPSDGQRVQP